MFRLANLACPILPETPVNEVSEKVMEMTIPFALGWGAVLTGVTAGVGIYNKKKQAASGWQQRKPEDNLMKLNVAVPRRLYIFRLSPLVWILLTLMGIAFVVAMVRYAVGIGAISDLSYSYPWGFWISFDSIHRRCHQQRRLPHGGICLHSRHQGISTSAAALRTDRLPRLHHGGNCPAG